MPRFPDDGLDEGPDHNALGFELELLIALCARQIAQGADFATYSREVGLSASALARGAEQGEHAEHLRRLILVLARAIWKQCPHPAHRYAPAPLPPAERNAACFCGSGRKYKHCCQPLESELPPLNLNWLASLIEVLPKTRWKELIGSRISLEMMIDLAMGWQTAGRPDDIVALLEPWFVDDAHLTHRFEPLQHLLVEAYFALHKPRKKADLLDRAIARGDAATRSSAQQRRASMAADSGDFARAWDLFRQAQRAAPDDFSLSHLEVILLMSEGREHEARERAKFWLAKLSRRSDAADLEGLFDFLRSTATQGVGAMVDIAASMDPNVGAFRKLWEAAPPIASLYALEADADSAGPLTPRPKLERVLSEWRSCVPATDYSPLRQNEGGWWESSTEWMGMLESHPELWNCFDVLDGLVEALLELPTDAGRHLARPLLVRSETLLREVIRTNQCEGLKLEWHWQQNRPALNLLGHLIASEQGDEPGDTSIARMEWLVGKLNPDDNLGVRFELMRALLLRDRFDDAIALSDRYPDDFASMRYNRALALFAAGRIDQAAQALREAAAISPKVLKYLLAANPKPVKQEGFGIRIGGNDEAWLYRLDHLDLWQSHQALDWARQVTGKRRSAKQ